MLTSTASAQINNLPSGAVVQPLPDEDGGAALRGHLVTLAENPQSLSALIGAGRAAIEMGDASAAIGFFARAEEVAPSDARVKAGMASALVRMEQTDMALMLFTEAVALGAPIAEIAADRGLAFDMAGDPARAQQDYALALRTRDDAELRRRYALSLAIGGQRDAALAAIDDSLRQQDRAAWRTRAFILALTGDMEGAHEAARATMPAPAADAMAPFLARLSGLSPAQKAAAVHFGRIPSEGRAMQMADVSGYDASSGSGDRVIEAGTGGSQPLNPPPEPVSDAPRRRPGESAEAPTTLEQRDFGEIAALVSTLPVEAATSAPVQAEPARPAARRDPPRRAAAPAHPSRIWVQVAGGANKAALPREFARLKTVAPNLLGDRIAYSVPLRLTNRLLVGPFRSDREAQEFVNSLARHDLAAFAWTSPAGQEIERLPAR